MLENYAFLFFLMQHFRKRDKTYGALDDDDEAASDKI